MDSNNYFAVDLGATSGRTILCSLCDGKFKMKEISRFPNHIIRTGGHYFWDIYALYHEIVEGLKLVAQSHARIDSIGIDTWGVDFVLIGDDGQILRTPYSYRDPHTVGIQDKFFEKVPKDRVYELTGIQFMDFNSLFQLYALRLNGCSALEAARKILFMPDAFSYMLTGEMVTEYTIASTSQMQNPRTRKLDPQLLAALGLPEDAFGRAVNPGEVIGTLSAEVQRLTGLGPVPVVAVAGHDTASAVAAVPARNKNFAYLSSGTWSLMGIEVPDPIISKESYEMNFTNEGGIEGTTRFLKNICGMWLLERCRDEWKSAGEERHYNDINAAAMAAEPFRSLINPDSPCFANPDSMIDAIRNYCKLTVQPVPQSFGEIARCIFDSLALRYRQVFLWLQSVAPFKIEQLHIIGGGSQNTMLDQFTCNAVDVPVLAGPTEGTAIGNVMLQAKAQGAVSDIWDMRRVICDSVETKSFKPQKAQVWAQAYEKFLKIYRTDI